MWDEGGSSSGGERTYGGIKAVSDVGWRACADMHRSSNLHGKGKEGKGKEKAIPVRSYFRIQVSSCRVWVYVGATATLSRILTPGLFDEATIAVESPQHLAPKPLHRINI